jgi:lipopolysaccharide O-acetyltransferase
VNANVSREGLWNRMSRFINVNGLYLFICELGRRCGVRFRRQMLAGKLGSASIILGPRCYLRGLAHISIGENFQAAEGLWLEAITENAGETFTPRIVIGNNVAVSRWSHIAASHSVEIGDGALIGSRVIITDHNHGRYDGPYNHTSPEVPPLARPLDCDKTVVIGRNVWLGDGVVVTPGSGIGEGSVIGANSVVTGIIPPFTIAAGVPAKPLKRYDFNTKEWIRIK